MEVNYKYKYNNGFISMSDTHAACMNFVNALEKIPGIIPQYEERTAKLKADVPTLEGIMAKSWGKEDELKQLKSELAAIDRKITAELAQTHEVPDDRTRVNHDENDGTAVNQEQSQQPQSGVKTETTSNTVVVQPTNPEQGHKSSMVAEPQPRYPLPVSPARFPSRHAGI